MTRKIIDWQTIKANYVGNTQETLSGLAKKYNINPTTIRDKAAKEKWTKLRQETLRIADQKTTEKLGDKISDVNIRQAKIGAMFQGIAVNAIQEVDDQGVPKIKPKTVEEVRNLALTGVTIERKALNIERELPPSVAIQINLGGKNLIDTDQELLDTKDEWSI